MRKAIKKETKKDKVFIVTGTFDYESSAVLGVFSTRSRANHFRLNVYPKLKGSHQFDWMNVEPWVVNSKRG